MKNEMIVFAFITLLLFSVSVSLTETASAEEGQAAAVTEGQPKAPVEEPKPASVSNDQKARLNSLFKAVQEKAKDIKPAKYEVTVPVSTAGARGAESSQTDRFAVIWPDAEISPISALAENLRSAIAEGAGQETLKAQLEDFKKVFPEFNDHELIHELDDIIKQVK